MTIRELSEVVHVSTSTIIRFCKKNGCEGYAEFRVQFKLFLKEEKENKKKLAQDNGVDEIMYFLHTVTSTAYEESIPDFSVCAKVTVSIENMNEIRRENFRKCDVKCAEKWSREKYEGKSRWTPNDVKQWRKENGYTWHERNDMVVCDLVPTKINRFFGTWVVYQNVKNVDWFKMTVLQEEY